MYGEQDRVAVARGTRVQIRFQVLGPGERADNVPPDTAVVPYEVRVKGVLETAAHIGEDVTITTAAGRQIFGRLEVIDPAYTHSFGRPAKALVEVQEAIRTLIHGGAVE